MRCEVCGDYGAYRCPHCGGTYCRDHIHPYEHFCEGFSRRGKFSLLSYGVNNLIVLTCTILFFASFLFYKELIELFALHPEPAELAKRPWQIVTSIFLHVDFWHFFINMFVLLFFGGELERRLGSRRYSEVFFASGIVGSVGYVIYANTVGDPIPALGASGAIFGVFGCLALVAPEIRIMIFPIPIPIGIRTALVLFAVYEFWMMLLSSLHYTHTNVANVAHLAGLLVGLYYGRKFRKRRIPIY
ncbi:MAG: rhomboid family intramembrane serine protease [Archaeoglobaceae archaeon]